MAEHSRAADAPAATESRGMALHTKILIGLVVGDQCDHGGPTSENPGAEVAIGENGPRYSSGALGFMSHVSRCDAPPQRKNRIVDLAVPARTSEPVASVAVACEISTPGNAANPVADATSIVLLELL